jgi:uncharacterized Zn finger protein (UPF0148 family)
MGKNPCPLCGTPEARYVDGRFHCDGCQANVKIERLVQYLQKVKKSIDFAKATIQFESIRPVMSFGEWLIQRNYELVGKP